MQTGLLLLLLFAVVISFAQSLKVVDVPEEFGVAAMLFDVIDNRAVWRWILSDKQDAGLLAGEQIALENILAQLLPSSGLIPLAPRCSCITLALDTLAHISLIYIWKERHIGRSV